MAIKRVCVGSAVWILIAAAIMFIPNLSPWIGIPIVLIGIILVPGSLLLINLDIIPDTFSVFLLYATGLGIAFLTFGGLAINWALPYFGIIHPLARLPLLICITVIVLILALRAYLFKKDRTIPYRSPQWGAMNLAFAIIPLFFIAASVIGATILNDGGTGALTLVMLFAIALYVFTLVALRKRIDEWVYMDAIYCIGLSVLLMYSLRSGHILGWDINQEYQVFQATLKNLRWSPTYFPGLDYNACVSITILPTIFKEFINVSSEYIYKVVFQLIFAVVPVMVYALARRYLNATLAFLAAFALVAQTWFFEQMPALIRQEIAFLFFIVVVLALFDESLSKRARYILFYVFTAGIIVSHYSTAYVWLALLVIALVLSGIARIFNRPLRKERLVVTPLMLGISVVILLIWQFPLTSTAGKVTQFATNNNGPSASPIASTATSSSSTSIARTAAPTGIKAAALTAVAPIIAPPGGEAKALYNAIRTTLFSGVDPNTDANVLAAQQYAISNYGAQAGYLTYPDASTTEYVPTAIHENIQIPSALPIPLSDAITLMAQADRFIFVDIFTIIGIIGMYIVARRRSYDFIFLNVGAYILIVLMLLIPYLQTYYNLTRLYLQMFLILGILAVIGGTIALKYLSKYQTMIIAAMAVVMFLSLTGALDQLTGGDARITLDQPPSTLEEPYVYDTEVAGAQWLAAHRSPNAPIQTDDVANLRLQSFGDIALSNSAIFPQTIERNSYVYLISANITSGEAFYQYAGNVLVYNYPLDFLNTEKNLLYNDGGSRIYR